MMGSSKPMASLSSGLLARKGQAKPAMRPQGFVSLSPNGSYDDLGWNDMGDEPVAVTQPVHHQPVEKPAVLRQIEAIEQKIAAPAPVAAAPKPMAPAAAVRVAKAVAAKTNKAAFTLRLDTDRHLRLRLASAVTNRSAQQIVTEALDAFLDAHPEVGALARQIGPAKDNG